MLVDTIQLVWTHDCEHGVINGFDIRVENGEGPVSVDASGAVVEKGSYFVIEDDYIQCGPEQILAKLPIVVIEREDSDEFISQARFIPDEEMLHPN